MRKVYAVLMVVLFRTWFSKNKLKSAILIQIERLQTVTQQSQFTYVLALLHTYWVVEFTNIIIEYIYEI